MNRRLQTVTVLALLSTACGAPSAAGGADAGDEFSLTPAAHEALLRLSPATLPPPPHDASNRFADDAVAASFGQRLFFDTGFSGALLDSDNTGDARSLGMVGESGKVACAGCHIPAAGFLDDRSTRKQLSLAAGWSKRRTRSLLDVGQARVIMWDGRHDALYNQPFEALENARDMNSSRLFAAEQIYERHRAEYEAIFGAIPIPLDDPTRFPQLDGTTTGCKQLSSDNEGVDCHGMPGDGAEFDGLQSDEDRYEVTRIVVNMGKALGAYERLLSCGPSRFDRWMHGESTALTPSEQRGAALFVGQRADGTTIAGCDTCHGGPFFSDQSFHNVGLRPAGVGPAGSFYDLDDHGARDGFAGILEDPINVRGPFSDGDDGRLDTMPPNADGAFRTPSLRCVSKRPSFMHTGQIATLADVVTFFSRSGDTAGFEGTSENRPRNFTSDEAADLVAFLEALDGSGPDEALMHAPQ